MSNISSIVDCYGCGLCATICPKNIIKVKLNIEGFYEPTIDEIDKCIDCGLCLKVCAFSHDDLSLSNPDYHSYAAWSNTAAIRNKCSSGGASFEIGKYLISQGYKVCACKYNVDKQRAEHYIAATIEDLIASMGSKYIQSYTAESFKQIDRKSKYLITGTPCQIDSFRRYIQIRHIEDNFVLMDFFCHCVPSMWAWNKYLEFVKTKIGEIGYVSWRNKFTGWHDSWAMALDPSSESEGISLDKSLNVKKCAYNSRLTKGDLFYKLFLGDYCANKACAKHCKYKYKKSSADIRIGDLWGAEYKNDEKGVSALITLTPKGEDIVKKIDCAITSLPFEVVAEGQMKENLTHSPLRPLVMSLLKCNTQIPLVIWKFIFLLNKAILKIKRILK